MLLDLICSVIEQTTSFDLTTILHKSLIDLFHKRSTAVFIYWTHSLDMVTLIIHFLSVYKNGPYVPIDTWNLITRGTSQYVCSLYQHTWTEMFTISSSVNLPSRYNNKRSNIVLLPLIRHLRTILILPLLIQVSFN